MSLDDVFLAMGGTPANSSCPGHVPPETRVDAGAGHMGHVGHHQTSRPDIERLRCSNWSDGPDAPWTDRRRRFCVHLFRCDLCSHPENIHCPTGARLLAEYCDTMTIH